MIVLYMILGVLALCAFVILASWTYDQNWYKRHPAANAKFCEIDNELRRDEPWRLSDD